MSEYFKMGWIFHKRVNISQESEYFTKYMFSRYCGGSTSINNTYFGSIIKISFVIIPSIQGRCLNIISNVYSGEHDYCSVWNNMSCYWCFMSFSSFGFQLLLSSLICELYWFLKERALDTLPVSVSSILLDFCSIKFRNWNCLSVFLFSSTARLGTGWL